MWVNPSLDRVEIEKQMSALKKAGDEAVVKREYLGQDCYGGAEAVFPKWKRETHCIKHDVLMPNIVGNQDVLRFYTVLDPATTSVFAVLFLAYNPKTSQIFFLDEIYESDRRKTDPRSMWTRILALQRELVPNSSIKWRNYYDEAEAWFANDVMNNRLRGECRCRLAIS